MRIAAHEHVRTRKSELEPFWTGLDLDRLSSSDEADEAERRRYETRLGPGAWLFLAAIFLAMFIGCWLSARQKWSTEDFDVSAVSHQHGAGRTTPRPGSLGARR